MIQGAIDRRKTARDTKKEATMASLMKGKLALGHTLPIAVTLP